MSTAIPYMTTLGVLAIGSPLPIPGAVSVPVWKKNVIAAYAIVDQADAGLAERRWQLTQDRYAFSTDSNSRVLMHRLLCAAPFGIRTDHINRNRLDNRRMNLRLVDDAQNAWNTKMHPANKSGYRGVQFDCGRWRAVINNRGIRHQLGHFDTADEAAHAYDFACIKLRGDFAVLNFEYTDEEILDIQTWCSDTAPSEDTKAGS